MFINRKEYERIEKQLKHYKNISSTYQIMIADYIADIQKLKDEIIEKDRQIKRLEASKLKDNTSNQHE
ncbi:MAG: hypothetical protein Q4D02_01955 [Clostridia bacterium]|nr:hypothetical protein [Clostridia bacterium]